MKYEIHLKSGNLETLVAAKHEERDGLHLFFNDPEKPYKGIFFDASVVDSVSPVVPTEPGSFQPFFLDQPKNV